MRLKQREALTERSSPRRGWPTPGTIQHCLTKMTFPNNPLFSPALCLFISSMATLSASKFGRILTLARQSVVKCYKREILRKSSSSSAFNCGFTRHLEFKVPSQRPAGGCGGVRSGSDAHLGSDQHNGAKDSKLV